MVISFDATDFSKLQPLQQYGNPVFVMMSQYLCQPISYTKTKASGECVCNCFAVPISRTTKHGKSFFSSTSLIKERR